MIEGCSEYQHKLKKGWRIRKAGRVARHVGINAFEFIESTSRAIRVNLQKNSKEVRSGEMPAPVVGAQEDPYIMTPRRPDQTTYRVQTGTSVFEPRHGTFVTESTEQVFAPTTTPVTPSLDRYRVYGQEGSDSDFYTSRDNFPVMLDLGTPKANRNGVREIIQNAVNDEGGRFRDSYDIYFQIDKSPWQFWKNDREKVEYVRVVDPYLAVGVPPTGNRKGELAVIADSRTLPRRRGGVAPLPLALIGAGLLAGGAALGWLARETADDDVAGISTPPIDVPSEKPEPPVVVPEPRDVLPEPGTPPGPDTSQQAPVEPVPPAEPVPPVAGVNPYDTLGPDAVIVPPPDELTPTNTFILRDPDPLYGNFSSGVGYCQAEAAKYYLQQDLNVYTTEGARTFDELRQERNLGIATAVNACVEKLAALNPLRTDFFDPPGDAEIDLRLPHNIAIEKPSSWRDFFSAIHYTNVFENVPGVIRRVFPPVEPAAVGPSDAVIVPPNLDQIPLDEYVFRNPDPHPKLEDVSSGTGYCQARVAEAYNLTGDQFNPFDPSQNDVRQYWKFVEKNPMVTDTFVENCVQLLHALNPDQAKTYFADSYNNIRQVDLYIRHNIPIRVPANWKNFFEKIRFSNLFLRLPGTP